MVLASVLVSFFYKWLTNFPAPLVKEAIFFPLYILASFVEDKVTICSWIYLWAFYFDPLIYISVSFFFFFKHLLAGKTSLQKITLSKLPTELRVTAHCLQSQTHGHWYSGKLSLIGMPMIWEDCELSPLRTTSKDAASRESLKEKRGSNLS